MMWGCMLWDGVGYACKIDGMMDGELYTKILEDELKESLNYYGKDPSSIIFQQDNDPKHKSKVAPLGLKIRGLKSSHGQHNLQTSIQLNISGLTSRGNWLIMKIPQMES